MADVSTDYKYQATSDSAEFGSKTEWELKLILVSVERHTHVLFDNWGTVAYPGLSLDLRLGRQSQYP